MTRSAIAYFTNNRLIVAPVSRSVGGDALAGAPRWFGRSAKKAIVAQAIAEALAQSADGLPDPDEAYWKGRFIPFQDAADVKNFKTFMRDARCVDIDASDDGVTLTPSTNLGPNNGFEPVVEAAVTVSANDMDAVAGTLLELFGLRPAAG